MKNELNAFHGSDDNFQEFDAAYIKQSLYGWGFNFTTDIELAMDFGKNIYTVEIPDDANLCDFETTDVFDELFELFIKDIENCGIDKDFIDVEKLGKMPFREQFWMLQQYYVKLTETNADDALKRLTEHLKTLGFVGSKYKDIYVIFERKDFKVKNVKRMDESINFSDIVRKVIK